MREPDVIAARLYDRSNDESPTRLALVQLAAAVWIGLVLAPAGAQAFRSQELTCSNSWDLVQSLLKRHVSFRGLDTELRERAIEAYIDQIDSSKTLFLSSEVEAMKRRLTGVFFAVQNGECEMLDDIQADLVTRYERLEKNVRAFVSRDDYALDTDVRLILDPDKRGHPEDDEARKRLLERLVHFQMSNYLSSDMELPKAKEKLIHRYELMTKRAKEFEPRDTYGTFLNAFAGALDPHSAYYPPEADEDFQIQMSLSLDGIGVALSSKDGYSVVERIIPGGATDKTDALEPGDKLIAVAQEGEDPVDIVDMSLRDVVAMIRGERRHDRDADRAAPEGHDRALRGGDRPRQGDDRGLGGDPRAPRGRGRRREAEARGDRPADLLRRPRSVEAPKLPRHEGPAAPGPGGEGRRRAARPLAQRRRQARQLGRDRRSLPAGGQHRRREERLRRQADLQRRGPGHLPSRDRWSF